MVKNLCKKISQYIQKRLEEEDIEQKQRDALQFLEDNKTKEAQEEEQTIIIVPPKTIEQPIMTIEEDTQAELMRWATVSRAWTRIQEPSL